MTKNDAPALDAFLIMEYLKRLNEDMHDMKDEMRGLRKDMKNEIGRTRKDMKDDKNELLQKFDALLEQKTADKAEIVNAINNLNQQRVTWSSYIVAAIIGANAAISYFIARLVLGGTKFVGLDPLVDKLS